MVPGLTLVPFVPCGRVRWGGLCWGGQAAQGPAKTSFMPKFFSSKKTRESIGTRDAEAMYKAGKEKVAARSADLTPEERAAQEVPPLPPPGLPIHF